MEIWEAITAVGTGGVLVGGIATGLWRMAMRDVIRRKNCDDCKDAMVTGQRKGDAEIWNKMREQGERSADHDTRIRVLEEDRKWLKETLARIEEKVERRPIGRQGTKP